MQLADNQLYVIWCCFYSADSLYQLCKPYHRQSNGTCRGSRYTQGGRGASFSTAAQFLGESLLLCFTAFIVAMVLSALLIPLFNQLAGKTISKGIWYHLPQAGYMLLAGIVLGILSGLYPAIVLARFQPVMVLKGGRGTTGATLHKGLVMAQFTISIALIIATITVYRQKKRVGGYTWRTD